MPFLLPNGPLPKVGSNLWGLTCVRCIPPPIQTRESSAIHRYFNQKKSPPCFTQSPPPASHCVHRDPRRPCADVRCMWMCMCMCMSCPSSQHAAVVFLLQSVCEMCIYIVGRGESRIVCGHCQNYAALLLLHTHTHHKRYASLMPCEALDARLKSIIASIGCPAASSSRACW